MMNCQFTPQTPQQLHAITRRHFFSKTARGLGAATPLGRHACRADGGAVNHGSSSLPFRRCGPGS